MTVTEPYVIEVILKYEMHLVCEITLTKRDDCNISYYVMSVTLHYVMYLTLFYVMDVTLYLHNTFKTTIQIFKVKSVNLSFIITTTLIWVMAVTLI